MHLAESGQQRSAVSTIDKALGLLEKCTFEETDEHITWCKFHLFERKGRCLLLVGGAEKATEEVLRTALQLLPPPRVCASFFFAFLSSATESVLSPFALFSSPFRVCVIFFGVCVCVFPFPFRRGSLTSTRTTATTCSAPCGPCTPTHGTPR